MLDLKKYLNGNPVVFLSGGIDSLLTLYLVREQKKVPVVIFAADFSKEQMKALEKLIFEWDLTVYIYPPKNRYFIGNGKKISLVDEYGFGGLTLPVVRDIEPGNQCAFNLSSERCGGFNLGWDTVFCGVLATDKHYAFTSRHSQDAVYKKGGITFVAPLKDWTKSSIIRTAQGLGIDKYVVEGTGDLRACYSCLEGKRCFCPLVGKEIEPVDWQPKEMLKEFQKRVNL